MVNDGTLFSGFDGFNGRNCRATRMLYEQLTGVTTLITSKPQTSDEES